MRIGVAGVVRSSGWWNTLGPHDGAVGKSDSLSQNLLTRDHAALVSLLRIAKPKLYPP
jgi:hypothetical protein